MQTPSVIPKCHPLAQRTRSMWRRRGSRAHNIDGVSEPYNEGTGHARYADAKSKTLLSQIYYAADKACKEVETERDMRSLEQLFVMDTS